MTTRPVRCTLNGRFRTLEVDETSWLLDSLRAIGLTGAKPSCDVQVCGACTVILDDLPVSACTTLTVEADGRVLETIEGVGAGDDLHPVQEAFLKHFAFQCGYCTPGMILTAVALLRQHPEPTHEDVVHWMEGSICRCTGYESIEKAILAAAEVMASSK